MYDIHIILADASGELARLGETLGENGIGLEGGGVFSSQTLSHAHFLVEEGERARAVLENHGFMVVDVIKPLIRRLRQERPGELGAIARTLATYDINIITQYSDHDNQLILVTDNPKLAAQVTSAWAV